MRHLCLLVCVTLCLFSPSRQLSAQGETAPEDDTNKIIEAVESYVTVFNAQKAEQLANLWTSDGVYHSRVAEEQIRGRDALAQRFAEVFAGDQPPKLAVRSESIEFISPRVAVERGRATVTGGTRGASETRYTAVYVKEGEKWLIDRITEEELTVAETRYERLKPLEWLIGSWVDVGEDFTIEIDSNWTANQNYISRSYSVSNDDGTASSGLQIIGWDENQKQIRSWLFDAEGGFVSGEWKTQDDGDWVVNSVATLADGSTGSYTSVFRPQEDGTYTWMKTNRVLDGQLLPNIDEITVQRR